MTKRQRKIIRQTTFIGLLVFMLGTSNAQTKKAEHPIYYGR